MSPFPTILRMTAPPEVQPLPHRDERPAPDVISYKEMCLREGVKVLERGLNFRLNPTHSVLLLSSRPYASYENRISQDGSVIECEGHDIRKNMLQLDPKAFDQQRTLKSGKLTQNGLFAEAAEQYAAGKRDAEPVHIYEKLAWGLWRSRGTYGLVKSCYVRSGTRMVFRFRLERIQTSSASDAQKVFALNPSAVVGS
jgi:hypothetical protein